MRSIRPGRSSASSSASGRLVAIMTRIRYFGGGFGRMPSDAPDVPVDETARLLQAGQLGEQGLQRAHAAAAAHAAVMT